MAARTREDAEALLGRIQTQQATTAELAEGMALMKAIEAVEVLPANSELDGENAQVLKAWGLMGEEPAEEPAAEETPDAAAVAAQAAEISKSLANLPAATNTGPSVGDLMDAIAEQGEPAKQAVEISGVLQASVATYDRMAKAMEDLAVIGAAQNHLLGQVVNGYQELQKSLAAMPEQMAKAIPAPVLPENPETVIANAIQKSFGGTNLMDRLANVEQTMNNRPWSGNPPRSSATENLLEQSQPVPYYKAIAMIQQAPNLEDQDKAEALATLQSAVSTGQPFTTVLKAYGVPLQAAA